MVTYHYKATSENGVKTRGVIQATDEYEAVTKIKQKFPIVLEISEVKKNESFLTKEIGHKKINTKALSVMCSQFAIILKSGVSLATCMNMIADQTTDKQLKKMLVGSAEDVEQGSPLATAFEKNCKELPITFIETVRAGEESGTLENSFETLEKYYEKSYKNNQKVKRALAYPIFVICIAIIVVAIVMVKVIPTVASSFLDLGGEMPLVTRILIGVSNFFSKYILVILAVLILIFIGLKLYFATEKGRVSWNAFKLKAPVLGKINLLNGASQFSNTMATLLEAGLPVNKSLEITSKVLSNYVLETETSRMIGGVEEGKRLGECMEKCKYFPKTLVEMCALGEETGEMEETLRTTGSYFDNEADHETAKAISRLEPTILVLMAVFAGFIVIAIYLPMFTMYTLI